MQNAGFLTTRLNLFTDVNKLITFIPSEYKVVAYSSVEFPEHLR